MRRSVRHLLRKLSNGVPVLRRHEASCYLGDGRVLSRVRGFKMVCPARDMSMTPHLVLDGYWEMAVTQVFEGCLKPGMTVLDIGANIGYFALHAARAVGGHGRVVAFEPEPRNLWYLHHNLALNGFASVEIVGKALWKEAGTMTLRLTEDSSGGHSLLGDAAGSEEKTVPVETVTLDAFLGGDKAVDVIKMDAEGAEPFILEGMSETLAANPKLKILMEFAPLFLTGAGLDYHEYLRGLEAMGFSVGLIESDATVKPIDIARIDELIPTRPWPQMLMLDRG